MMQNFQLPPQNITIPQLDKFTLRVSHDLITILKKEASKEGRSLSAYIRRRLEAHVNKTKQRAFVTHDILGPLRGFNGEEIPQMGRKKESARCSTVD